MVYTDSFLIGRAEMDNSWQPQVVDAVSKAITAFWPQGLKRSEQKVKTKSDNSRVIKTDFRL